MIAEIGIDRDAARALVDRLQALLGDIEALHEPSSGGDCPTCGVEAPCVTLALVHGDITLEQAFASVRDQTPIDLTEVETRQPPPVPSLAELLAERPSGADRFFAALLDSAPKSRHDRTA